MMGEPIWTLVRDYGEQLEVMSSMTALQSDREVGASLTHLDWMGLEILLFGAKDDC